MIQDARQAKLLPFILDAQYTGSLADAAQTTITLQTPQDAVFELHNVLIWTSADAETDTRPNNITLLITDLSTARDLSNRAIPQAIYDRLNSIREFRPVQFSPLTDLQFVVNNVSGGALTKVNISLKGYKLYKL